MVCCYTDDYVFEPRLCLFNSQFINFSLFIIVSSSPFNEKKNNKSLNDITKKVFFKFSSQKMNSTYLVYLVNLYWLELRYVETIKSLLRLYVYHRYVHKYCFCSNIDLVMMNTNLDFWAQMIAKSNSVWFILNSFHFSLSLKNTRLEVPNATYTFKFCPHIGSFLVPPLQPSYHFLHPPPIHRLRQPCPIHCFINLLPFIASVNLGGGRGTIR